jgi:hypothetical protein
MCRRRWGGLARQVDDRERRYVGRSGAHEPVSALRSGSLVSRLPASLHAYRSCICVDSGQTLSKLDTYSIIDTTSLTSKDIRKSAHSSCEEVKTDTSVGVSIRY